MKKIKDQPLTVYSVIERPVQIPFWNEIVCGDSADLLKMIPDDSIDLIITSPPYFQQREYDGGGIGNEKTHQEYISSLLNIFRECVRVIKPTGSIVFNVGDKYDDSSLLLMPYRFAIAATEQCGVTLVNNVTWVKSNPTPRQFKRRLVSSTEPFFHFVKTQNYKYFIDEFLKPIDEPKPNGNGTGENAGKKYFSLIEQSLLTPKQKELARNALVESLKNCPHPAIYPVKIVDEFIKLLTEKGDVILDPFVGSGSTAVAAFQNERVYIGFDISEEYCLYAQKRVSSVKHQLSLWERDNAADAD